MSKSSRRPAITICRSDHQRLTDMADGLPDQNSALALALSRELDRARVVEDRKLGGKTIRIGSKLSYRPDNGPTRTIRLVLPNEADIAKDRVSVLTPIGAALIGLSEGQAIDWTDRSGRRHLLEVVAVESQAEAPMPPV